MAFQVCQELLYRGTAYMQDPDGKGIQELDAMEVERKICGDAYDTADEAWASFHSSITSARKMRFVTLFLFSTLRVTESVPDPAGPKLEKVKSFGESVKEFLLGMGQDPYVVD